MKVKDLKINSIIEFKNKQYLVIHINENTTTFKDIDSNILSTLSMYGETELKDSQVIKL